MGHSPPVSKESHCPLKVPVGHRQVSPSAAHVLRGPPSASAEKPPASPPLLPVAAAAEDDIGRASRAAPGS